MSWTDTRDGILAAIRQAGGLASGKVIWGYQNVDQPHLDYVSLSLSGFTTIGIDQLVSTTDLLRPPGTEIAQTVNGLREVTLDVQVFTKKLAEEGDALSLADKIQTGLLLPTARALMAAQNVVPFDKLAIEYIPEVVSAGFRGRALAPVRLYMPAQKLVEYVGYITSVEGTVTIRGGRVSPSDFPFVIG